jgi:hypothetical protein
MARVSQVRRGSVGLINNSAVEVFGDGPGAENTISCGEFNEMEVFMTYRRNGVGAGTVPRYRFYFSDDGINFFQVAFYTDSAAVNPSLQVFSITAATDITQMFSVPIRGAFCRISFELNDAAATSAQWGVQVSLRMR